MTVPISAGRPLIVALCALWPALAMASGAARLDFVIGAVTAENAAGGSRLVQKGSQLAAGETVRTSADGRAQLRFTDGAMVSLQPDSVFKLDEYRFAGPEKTDERAFFSLLKGGLRTITGLVGRFNRSAYKVHTAVATIGIRGTEYSLAYLADGGLAVATGEGEIEICNDLGCSLLSSGEAAVVPGRDQPMLRTASRPRLDPAQPTDLLLAVFSTAEDRNDDGSVRLNDGLLTSGSGYAAVWAQGTSSGDDAPLSAEFGPDGQLLSFRRDNGEFIRGVTLAESANSDGVIGWGRWQAAIDQAGDTYSNFHYLIGRETVGFAGVTATYHLVGATTPTSTNGNLGSLPSGTLTANLSGGVTSLQLAMTVPINASNYNLQGTTSTTTASFEFASLSGANVYSGDAKGKFYGVNAAHAGVSYKFLTSGYDTVTGVAAFKR